MCLLTAVLAGSLAGCESNANEPDVAGGSHDNERRIVSLSPAISRTLVDLEVADAVVGRTPYCDSLSSELAIAGDLLDVNMEVLVRLRPTHVLVQPPASGLSPALKDLAEKRGWRLGAWQLDGVDDIHRMLRELPNMLAGDDDALNRELAERSRSLREAISEALDAHRDESLFGGRVLLLVGLEPVTVFGSGTYLNDLLTAFGARNAVCGRGYPSLTLEDVLRIDPEAVLLVAPGSQAADAEMVRQQLGPIGRLDIQAVRDGRVAVLSHPDAFMPSSAVIHVAAAMRDILQQWAMTLDQQSNARATGATQR